MFINLGKKQIAEIAGKDSQTNITLNKQHSFHQHVTT